MCLFLILHSAYTNSQEDYCPPAPTKQVQNLLCTSTATILVSAFIITCLEFSIDFFPGHSHSILVLGILFSTQPTEACHVVVLLKTPYQNPISLRAVKANILAMATMSHKGLAVITQNGKFAHHRFLITHDLGMVLYFK